MSLIFICVVLGQSGGDGGGSTNPSVPTGASADANMATTTNNNTFGAALTQTVNGTLVVSNQVIQATGTFTNNGTTVVSNLTVNGLSKFLGATNLFVKAVTIGTNAFTSADFGADLYIDKRSSGGQANVYIHSASANTANLTIGCDVSDANREFSMSGGNGNTWNNIYENGLTVINTDIQSSSALFNIRNSASQNIAVFGGASIILNTNVVVGSGGTRLASIITTNATYDAPSINTLTQFNTNIVCTGALSNSCIVSVSANPQTAGIIYQGACVTNDAVQIQMHNYTGGSVDPANTRVDVLLINK